MTKTFSTPTSPIRTSAAHRNITLHAGNLTRLPRHEQHAHRDAPP